MEVDGLNACDSPSKLYYKKGYLEIFLFYQTLALNNANAIKAEPLITAGSHLSISHVRPTTI